MDVRDRRWRERFPCMPSVLVHPRGIENIDIDRLFFRIDNPILWHAATLIHFKFEHPIVGWIGFGQDLHTQIRNASNPFRRDDPSIFVHDDHEIGLDNVVIRELDIVRSVKHSPPFFHFDLRIELKLQVPGYRLVFGGWRRIHVMISIDDFVAFSIVGEVLILPIRVLVRGIGIHEEDSLEMLSRRFAL